MKTHPCVLGIHHRVGTITLHPFHGCSMRVLTTLSMEDKKSPLSRWGNQGSVPVSPIRYVVFNQPVPRAKAVPLPAESEVSMEKETEKDGAVVPSQTQLCRGEKGRVSWCTLGKISQLIFKVHSREKFSKPSGPRSCALLLAEWVDTEGGRGDTLFFFCLEVLAGMSVFLTGS